MTTPTTVHFGALGHDKGNDCPACAHTPGYPEPHECGGYLHAEQADDDEGFAIDDTVVVACDTCGAKATLVLPPRNGEAE